MSNESRNQYISESNFVEMIKNNIIPSENGCKIKRNSEFSLWHEKYGTANIMSRIRPSSRFKNDFTITFHSFHDGLTELQKIMDGNYDYLFCGYENETGDDLTSWFIVDLEKFRQLKIEFKRTSDTDPYIGDLYIGDKKIGCTHSTKRIDHFTGECRGTDYFYCIDRRKVPEIIVATFPKEYKNETLNLMEDFNDQ